MAKTGQSFIANMCKTNLHMHYAYSITRMFGEHQTYANFDQFAKIKPQLVYNPCQLDRKNFLLIRKGFLSDG